MTELLDAIGVIITFVSVLAGGTVLTYYMLPRISEHIHANLVTLVWVTVLLSLYVFFLHATYIEPLIILAKFIMNKAFYKAITFDAAQRIFDLGYLLVSLWLVKISFFPEKHHDSI